MTEGTKESLQNLLGKFDLNTNPIVLFNNNFEAQELKMDIFLREENEITCAGTELSTSSTCLSGRMLAEIGK